MECDLKCIEDIKETGDCIQEDGLNSKPWISKNLALNKLRMHLTSIKLGEEFNWPSLSAYQAVCRAPTFSASSSWIDVRHVLNRSGALNPSRIFVIEHSPDPSISSTFDHLSSYCRESWLPVKGFRN